MIERAARGEPTFLETALPIRELSILADTDRRAIDPVYQAHRWWARRPPSLMRGLLLAAALPGSATESLFWDLFADSRPSLVGLHVQDPFAGGGSTLVEASRLGARSSGSDVDPLAVEITRHELDPPSSEAVRAAGEKLLAHLKDRLGDLYPGTPVAIPLHYFWLYEVVCPACNSPGLLYRDLVLCRDAGKSGGVTRDYPLTVFCPLDFRIHQLRDANAAVLSCGRHRIPIRTGTFRAFKYVCRDCGAKWGHKDLKTGTSPRKLIAVEETVTGGRRRIRPPTDEDDLALLKAQATLEQGADLLIPDSRLSEERLDPRPLSYGIDTAQKLFSPRQLVVMGAAMSWVQRAGLEPRVKRAITLAISSALATNNKLCSYAIEYGRLAPLFSVRSYPLPALPVELNPLHPESGRGTIRRCIERVARSGSKTIQRYCWSVSKGAAAPIAMSFTSMGPGLVTCSRADRAQVDGEVDLCVFDPPYFDYIAYSELSEFFRCWHSESKPAGIPLHPTGNSPVESFGLDLGACLRASLRQLATGRPIVFTYHSANPQAWHALGIALDEAKLAVTALWPIRSDGHMGHHSQPGNCEWDLVFVCRRLDETELCRASFALEDWVHAVSPLTIGQVDRTSMSYAINIASGRYGRVARNYL